MDAGNTAGGLQVPLKQALLKAVWPGRHPVARVALGQAPCLAGSDAAGEPDPVSIPKLLAQDRDAAGERPSCACTPSVAVKFRTLPN